MVYVDIGYCVWLRSNDDVKPCSEQQDESFGLLSSLETFSALKSDVVRRKMCLIPPGSWVRASP